MQGHLELSLKSFSKSWEVSPLKTVNFGTPELGTESFILLLVWQNARENQMKAPGFRSLSPFGSMSLGFSPGRTSWSRMFRKETLLPSRCPVRKQKKGVRPPNSFPGPTSLSCAPPLKRLTVSRLSPNWYWIFNAYVWGTFKIQRIIILLCSLSRTGTCRHAFKLTEWKKIEIKY